MNKKIKHLISLFLLLSAAVTAQNTDKFTGSLLWQISGNGLEKPSYVFGTHHLAPLSFMDEVTGLKEAVEEAQQVVGELDMNDMGTMQMKLMQAAALPDSITYNDLLNEEDYKRLNDGLVNVLGLGLNNIGRMKPGMISSLMSVNLYQKAYPDIPVTAEGIDRYLQVQALENEKTVLGLETVEDQIYALFDAEPLEAQVAGMVCAFSHGDYVERSVNMLKQLTTFYYAGDIYGMYSISIDNPDEPCPMTEASQHAILNHRNENWLKKLPGIMAEKPSLVAVGALHLAGEEGILYGLAQQGYTIEAVK